MKSPSDLLRFGLGPVIVVLIVGVSFAMANKHKNVEFGKDYAAIYPEAQISADDAESLNGVLKKYDKRIYRIQKYHKGRLVKTDGELSEKYMRDGLISEVKKEAKATKFTGWAIQAGVVADKTSSTHPGLGAGSSTHPSPSASPSASPPSDSSWSSTHPTPGAGAVDSGAGSSTHPSPSASPSASPPSDNSPSSTHPTQGVGAAADAGSSTHPTPGASPSPSAGSSTKAKAELTSSTKKLVDESEVMLKEIRPILEKYNKDTEE